MGAKRVKARENNFPKKPKQKRKKKKKGRADDQRRAKLEMHE